MLRRNLGDMEWPRCRHKRLHIFPDKKCRKESLGAVVPVTNFVFKLLNEITRRTHCFAYDFKAGDDYQTWDAHQTRSSRSSRPSPSATLDDGTEEMVMAGVGGVKGVSDVSNGGLVVTGSTAVGEGMVEGKDVGAVEGYVSSPEPTWG